MMNAKKSAFWLLLSVLALSGGVCFLTSPKAKVTSDTVAEERITEKEEEASDTSAASSATDKMPHLEDIVAGIVGDRALADVAYAWNDQPALKPGTSALLQMAVDETKRYEIYGIMSAELGTYGMLFNDRIGGTDNWNLVYEPWLYTGASADQPALSYETEQLIFTYASGRAENGKAVLQSVAVDCGYDTGHMEIR